MKKAAALLASVLVAYAQSPDERAWVAAKLYSSIRMYFAHQDGAPGFDLDRDFREYLKEAGVAPNRRAFSLATMRFVGKLRNGHSGFYDRSLREDGLRPLGFDLKPMKEGWVVYGSMVNGLAPGDIVVAVNDEPMEAFYTRLDPFLEGSSDRARRWRATWLPFLWPEKIELSLANGKRVSIDRTAAQPSTRYSRFPSSKLEPPAGVAYRRIGSFSDADQEVKHVDFVRQRANDKAIVFDVRGNGGGGTPLKLIAALMDRPWREMSYTTPMHIAHAGAQAQAKRAFPAEIAKSDYDRGYVEAFEEMEQALIFTLGPLHGEGQSPYTGKVIVVTDGGCNSACEDFLAPLKTSGRAVIVGEPTNGSSGQPYYYDFGNGMSFRVSTKRYFLSDGSPFEGTGIKPDVDVQPTLLDLLAGRDPVLAKAFELATVR